ncbi:OmpA family protein [Tenacibaculum sp. IB213877]|uniref:OmpA family protein n=1 Tax=Tenacibaculum sp. IB213877 TaxID=3097351 RepID=UPI002A5A5FB7|nr:OmpA family protein [Tenacibaculum sp. IB213877]MDY0779824.1 OmpA family protein [Tenacibaculum sp. IB213877]
MKTLKIKLLYIVLVLPYFIFAQKVSLKKADKNYQSLDFGSAISDYEKIAKNGLEDYSLYQKLGNSYYFTADLSNAKKWYEKLFKTEESIDSEYYFRYAHTLKATGNYDKADAIMSQFHQLKKQADKRGQLFESNLDYLEKIHIQSGRYEIKNLDINTPLSNFAPTFYHNQLVFSSEKMADKSSKNKKDDRLFIDLFTSEIINDGTLNYPIKFSNSINTQYHESTSTFTTDGNTIYFTRNNFTNNKINKDKDGTIKLKIYKAVKNGKGEWINIQELPFNSDEYSVAHPTLNADETKLYFVSDMPGGFGLSDLYEVTIHTDGSFGKPKNLGNKINTEGKETFPFMSKNGNLYFASNGRPGLGGLDIFVVNLSEDISAESIYNLGEPINSPFDDFSFIIDDTTKKGYFSSNRPGGKGKDDIYSLCEMMPIVKHQSPLEEIITSAPEQEKQAETVVKKDTGIHDVIIKEDTSSFTPKLNFNPIYFDFARYYIREDAQRELDKIAAAMKKDPTIKLEILSHTDSRATRKHNLHLSNKRALATINYLVEKGVERARLKGKGYGENQLLNDCYNNKNCPENKHKLNRRSEFKIFY